MVHGGMTLVKYLLFLFNFIFWLSGIAIVVAGAVLQIKYSAYANFLGDTFFSTPILLIVVGCVIALLGFFGCCGAIRENYCMTMTFAVLLGILFILELAAGIAGYVLKTELENEIKKHAMSGLSHYNQSGTDGVTDAWNYLQRTQQCCGIDNYTDWKNSTRYEMTVDVPYSCCKVAEEICDVSVRNLTLKAVNEHIHTDPCAKKLREWANDHVGYIAGVICGIAVIQIVGLVLSCVFGSRIRNAYEAV